MADGLTGIILAGGQSRRMGYSKALMPWQGGLLIDAVITRLRPVVDEVLIVAKDTTPFLGRGARVVTDREPESHPWVGVSTGLLLATYEVSFICACDMPWLEPAVIRYLRDALEGFDAAVLRRAQGLEPFHAVYARRCVPILAQGWQHGARTLQDLLARLYLRVVTEQELSGITGWERSLVNLNTPADCSTVH